MKTQQRDETSRASSEVGLVYWISLAEAERRFAVEHRELVARIRDGRLEGRRTLCDEDLVVAVSSKELAREFKPRPVGSVPAPRRVADSELLDSIRDELQDERVSRARLEGELASADKIERSIQRYADRLESELADSRKQAMTLARALGRAEQLATAAPKRLAAPARKAWWKPWA